MNKIVDHAIFSKLQLRLAIYHIRKETKDPFPFLDIQYKMCYEAINLYFDCLFVFLQVTLRTMYKQHCGPTLLSKTNGVKKGTIIILDSPRAMKGDSENARALWKSAHAGARMMIASVAKKHAKHGVHCVNAIIKGPMNFNNAEAVKTGKLISGEAMGSTYLWLSRQPATLWTHELDFRPAQA